MKKLLFIFTLSLLAVYCKKEDQIAYPEFILAGVTTGTHVLYTDIIPDDTVPASNTTPEYLYLDINHDKTDDFRLQYYIFQTPSMGNTHLSLEPLNNNEFAFAGTDSIMVDTIPVNFTIDKNLKWSGRKGTLYSSIWGSIPPGSYSQGLWMGVNDKVAGVRVFVGNDIVYGWIRPRISSGVFYVVYDYACTTRL